LAKLLDDVECGETAMITRHGRPIARLVPETNLRQEEVDYIIAEIKALSSRLGRVPIAEILSSLQEGHRY
jgi:antitoxin (DNA-binding transcriptional repressor) of toxin-antitoxin stability system